jgi:hypothetical protein
MERENTTHRHAKRAHHHVNEQDQASLHIEQDQLQRYHRLQPHSQHNPGRSTTSHANTTHWMKYTIQTPHMLPYSLEQLNHLCWAGDVGTAHIDSSTSHSRSHLMVGNS